MYPGWKRRGKGRWEEGITWVTSSTMFCRDFPEDHFAHPHPDFPKGHGDFCNVMTGEGQDFHLWCLKQKQHNKISISLGSEDSESSFKKSEWEVESIHRPRFGHPWKQTLMTQNETTQDNAGALVQRWALQCRFTRAFLIPPPPHNLTRHTGRCTFKMQVHTAWSFCFKL